MTTRTVQRQKEGTRQLGCRASEREEILITHAAKLDHRPRNSFILNAATAYARKVLEEHGVEEDSLFAKPIETPARSKRAAA